MPRFSLLPILVLLLLPAVASAQDEFPEQPRTAPRTDSPIVEKGPCFDVAAASMPDGPGHDHHNLAEHNFSCGFKQSAFLPLTDELAARPDVMVGESDVKADIAVAAVAYPEAGILTFDVKDPSQPKFQSWYRGGECDVLVLDTDCGAYVSLSDDGKMAFLSIQALSPLGSGGYHGSPPTTQPGVQVISLDDPTRPLLVDFLPVGGVNGVHTANYHKIPGNPAPDRVPGEYLFITQNGVGIQVAAIARSGGVGRLTPVNLIQVDEVHDTFLQVDPIDGRSYMYIAAGSTTGFYVYDVTNPLEPVLKAEWDLRPECHKDWYAHTIDVAVRNGRRYVTMPTEGFYFGPQGEDPSCGEIYGNGDRPGLLWIVDATDFSKLGPADASDGNNPPDPALAEASQKALVATWHNAANAAAGNLKFSPHNQQIVGDHIFMSQYHGGVVGLNAKAAFEGKHERPFEDAVVTPNSGKRPIYSRPDNAPGGAFISAFFASPGDIWDMNYYKGYVLAYDEHGGMYSFKFEPGTSDAGPQGPTNTGGCADRFRPVAKLRSVKLTRKGAKVTGSARDRGCGGKAGAVTRVSVSVSRKVGRKCTYLLGNGKFSKAKTCRSPGFQLAKGTKRFTFKVKGRLPKGRYTVAVQASDAAGNLSRGPKRTARVR